MPLAEVELINTLGRDKQIRDMALTPKGALVDFGAAGMQSLTDALAAALQGQKNVTIKLKSPVASIRTDRSVDGGCVLISVGNNEQRPEKYHKVISTTLAQDLARVTHGKLPSLVDCQAVDVMTVNLWFPDEDIKPPGTGYLIPATVWPEVNPERILGVFFDSDVQQRGPDEPSGTKLFVLMGGHYYSRPGAEIPSEQEAIAQARAALERHLGIPLDMPCHAVARLAPKCIPQHLVGHHERMSLAHLDLVAEFGGCLAVAGGSYGRIGTVAALRSAYDIATRMTHENWRDVTGIDEVAAGDFNFTSLSVDDITVRR